MGYCKHLSVLLLIAPLFAQAFEFRVLSFQGHITGLSLGGSGQFIPLSANEDTLSPRYTHTGSLPIGLYTEGAGSPAATDRKPVAQIPLPDGDMTNAILVLAHTPEGGYIGRWIDDSPVTNPAGTLSIHNFTGLALAMQSGQTTWQLTPGDTKRQPFADAMRQFPLRIATFTDQGWRLLLAAPIPVRRHYRIHLILRTATEADLAQNCPLGMTVIPDYWPAPAGN